MAEGFGKYEKRRRNVEIVNIVYLSFAQSFPIEFECNKMFMPFHSFLPTIHL